jgi:hypothetical protein
MGLLLNLHDIMISHRVNQPYAYRDVKHESQLEYLQEGASTLHLSCEVISSRDTAPDSSVIPLHVGSVPRCFLCIP